MPNKEEIRPEHPLIQDSIEILPDQSKDLNEPIVVENRQGTPPTRRQNWELANEIDEVGNTVFEEGEYKRVGGPKKKYGEKYSELYLPYYKRPDKTPRTTKDSSFVDASFEINRKHNGRNIKVRVHLDTFTAKRNRRPTTQEERRFAKLYYNEREIRFFVRVPKLGPDEKIDMIAWNRYIWGFMQRIKNGIDSGLFDSPNTVEPVVRYFRVIVPK